MGLGILSTLPPTLPWSPTLTRDFQSETALEKMRWDRDLGGGVLSFLDSRDLFLTTYGKERVIWSLFDIMSLRKV